MIISQEDYLAHYGTLHKSGRYPWGSGSDPQARHKDFLGYVESLRAQGLSEKEIARGIGGEKYSTTQLRNDKANARRAVKASDVARALRLKDKGLSNVAAAKEMGINESSYRALIRPGELEKAEIVNVIAKTLRDEIAEKKYIDVGAGVEHHMNIGRTKLNNALSTLTVEGYKIHYIPIVQLGTGLTTSMKVMAAPDITWKEVYKNRDQIRQVIGSTDDGGHSFFGIEKPLSISSKRVDVRYRDQGGKEADGVIYVRPGIPDVSLGSSRYAQVRIAVDGTHFIKGMAIYKEGLPAGVDLQFNTNKASTGNKLDALKPLKIDRATGKLDEGNPFGAVVKQIGDNLPGGRKRLTSVMNIVNAEGKWDDWSNTLSTQFLSKQPPVLAKAQLDKTIKQKRDELEAIRTASNPSVKRKLLEGYADDVSSSAVHLKAAALPRQSSRVILPVNEMKPNEIYAHDYNDGERVVLIRYPHGGIFEIPELTVNNRNPAAKKLLGDAKDAVGIHSSVAEKLSGADFDGDTVLVIPNPHGSIKSAPALAGLKGFDPQSAFPAYHGMKTMGGGTWNAETKKEEFEEGRGPSGRLKQVEMGKISNLITDMTIKGAPMSELARAVRHSMVVIDAEKHKLNYQESARVNGISQLKARYQSRPNSKAFGASTLISNAGTSSTVHIPKRKLATVAEGGPIDKATGALRFVNTGTTYVNKKGMTVPETVEVPKLSVTDNAHEHSSGTPIEKLYADHSNALKALANEARLEYINTKEIPYSKSAREAYLPEVKSLEFKLTEAQKNAPLERQAQVLANGLVAQKKSQNPDMDSSELKKIKFLALEEARNRTGAKKQRIEFTDNEWNAIQSGAITKGMLNKILSNADMDHVKQRAMPRDKPVMSATNVQRARAMLANGNTRAEIAKALGVSVTTLKSSLDPKEANNG